MSHRIDQINSLIEKELSQIILKEVDLPQGCLATITKVDTAKDLSQSYIWISVLPTSQQEKILKLLEDNLGHLNHLVSQKLMIRKMPKFILKVDIREEKASHIEELLNTVGREKS